MYYPRYGLLVATLISCVEFFLDGYKFVECLHAVYNHWLLYFFSNGYLCMECFELLVDRCSACLVKTTFANSPHSVVCRFSSYNLHLIFPVFSNVPWVQPDREGGVGVV